MPLTKLHITLPSGRRKSVYLRGQSLLDETGTAIGTVLVIDDVSERELLLDSFTRYVSRDLVKRLLARAEPLGLEGERRMCTILFADVRGFTSLAEGQKPEELHQLLNIYFRLMVDSILTFGGFIDKFVGDKVMALFTDGTTAKDHASAALNAARHIKASLKTLNDERRAQGLKALDVGVGVNTGEVMLGNIGSDRRMEFTAIGDPVNLADRLQALARNGEVYVGETTAALVGADFPLIDRGPQDIRGRTANTRLFELPET
jgi:class 3 adenylate cyclase